jgi:hypothetical protein
LEFMQQAVQGTPIEDFQNVIPLEKIASTKQVQVDVQDTAPPADAAEQGLTETPSPSPAPPSKPPKPAPPSASASPSPQPTHATASSISPPH